MKKIFKEKSKTIIFTVCFMFNSTLFLAQVDTVDGPEGPPTGSIDIMLLPMIIVAVLVAFNFYKNTKSDKFLNNKI